MPVIPAGLYSAGRYKIDLSPLDQVIRQRAAEKKAASDAASKYLASMQEKVNTVGVRDIDRVGDDGLDAKINQWVNWGTSNLDKITKGGQAQSDFIRGYKTILSDIEKSKNRLNTIKEIGKLKVEGKYDPDDDDLGVLDKIGKPIYDEESYKPDGSEYGWADLPANVPEFDPTKQTQFFNAAFGGAKPTYDEKNARVDNVTGDIFIPTGYSDADTKLIAENAANIYNGSKIAQKYYKKIMLDPAWMKEAQNAYQSIYGADQTLDSPAKAAAADAIKRAKIAGGETKITDPNYAQKLKKEMQVIRENDRKKRQAAARTRRASNPGKSLYEIYTPLAKDFSDGTKGIYLDDIHSDDEIFITGSKVDPYEDSNGNEYYKLNTDGSWEGKNGKINKERVLDMKPKGSKPASSSSSGSNVPGSDVAISQYPENLQRGILAFSQQNNLPLDQAIEILKSEKPEYFS
jgi:hypothetical protein